MLIFEVPSRKISQKSSKCRVSAARHPLTTLTPAFRSTAHSPQPAQQRYREAPGLPSNTKIPPQVSYIREFTPFPHGSPHSLKAERGVEGETRRGGGETEGRRRRGRAERGGGGRSASSSAPRSVSRCRSRCRPLTCDTGLCHPLDDGLHGGAAEARIGEAAAAAAELGRGGPGGGWQRPLAGRRCCGSPGGAPRVVPRGKTPKGSPQTLGFRVLGEEAAGRYQQPSGGTPSVGIRCP